MIKKIDYYCFSFKDFEGENDIKYENIPHLCSKFKLKKRGELVRRVSGRIVKSIIWQNKKM